MESWGSWNRKYQVEKSAHEIIFVLDARGVYLSHVIFVDVENGSNLCFGVLLQPVPPSRFFHTTLISFHITPSKVWHYIFDV